MLQQLTVGAKTYTERQKGVFGNTANVVGGPSDEFRIKPNTTPKNPSFAVTKYMHVVIPASGSSPERRVPVVSTLQVQIPANEPAITSAIVSGNIADITTLLTPAIVNRILLGEG